MNKKVIIFDLDGVLVDTIPTAREAFLNRHEGVTADMYNEIHSGNFHIEAKKYTHLKISETEEEKEKRETSYSAIKSKTQLFEGIKGLLIKLHSDGYILAVNTNAYDKNCLPLLESLGIKHLFDYIVTAEVSIDKREKFKLIEERYGVGKKDALFVTDSLGDVKDADRAEIPTVAVTWGVHDKTYFERDRYQYLVGIVDTVDNLSSFITKFMKGDNKKE